ncbi:MAG: hypothetical protein IOD05_01225 [Rhodobacter sp.]|nr:hypothetical protein [Rhodobacter sp.]MCA3491964.1 hypothetical protein [Rhodobacter sp.]MCA3500955.1 hypothetical protein [Rhodobacter sp.]MCA3501895.1 hypothetical protein [Rhodobacter sp.]MCA3515351.1 hypothetical protein [Rhodobacter sp.]
MGKVADIKDRETLEAWLKGRSRVDAVCIAHRAAMRVAPLFWIRLGAKWARKRDFTPLVTLRPLLTSGVTRKYPNSKVRRAADRATAQSAAYAAARGAWAAGSVRAASAADAAVNAGDVADATLAAHAANTRAAYAVRDADAAADANDAASARAVAAKYAARAANADPTAYASWRAVRNDCVALEAGRDPFTLPLWASLAPESIADAWAQTRQEWALAGGPVWAFWTQFYENALAGRPQDWPLLRDIALIPPKDWQGGPDRVHPIIEGMLKRRADQEEGKGEVAQDLAGLPTAPRPTIQQVQSALSLNRVALPPTFDAVEGFIALEIDRLQSRNHQTDDEAAEARRMIRTLSFLAEAVLQMRAAVPAEGPAKESQARDVEGLARVYMKKLGDLPRIKADEVVEGMWSAGKGACQVGLIGCSAALMVTLGLPALASVAAATLVFVPKLGSDAIKGAVELAKSHAKP